jgi:hypothetical protein
MARRRLCLGLCIALLTACGGGGGGGAAVPPDAAALAWTPSDDARVTGYRVYYGTQSRAYAQPWGAGIDVGRVEGFVVTGLSPGTRHYFAVTAYDADGNESDYSNEASKQVP